MDVLKSELTKILGESIVSYGGSMSVRLLVVSATKIVDSPDNSRVDIVFSDYKDTFS